MGPFDVVVVGGGIIGSTAAHWLASLGVRTALLDQGTPPAGATAATHSNLSIHNRLPGPEFEVAMRTRAMYEEMYGNGHQELELDMGGGVLLAASEEQVAEAQRRAVLQHQCGLPVEILDRQDLLDLDPTVSEEVVAGLYCPLSGHLYAPGACFALQSEARRHGAAILRFTRVVGIEVSSDRVAAVRTERGRLPCGAVVIAAGLEAGRLLATIGRHLPIVPNRGHIIVTEPARRLGVPLKGEILIEGTACYAGDAAGCEERRWNVRLVWTQTRRGHAMIGRSGEEGRTDNRVSLGAVRAILSRAARWIPAVRELRLMRVYTGVRPYTPDRLPVVGPVPDLEGVWVAAGFGDLGVGLAYAARLLAEEIVTGCRHELLAPFQLDRPGLKAVQAAAMPASAPRLSRKEMSR